MVREKPILIIRSCSWHRFEQAWSEIIKKFGQTEYWLLTSEINDTYRKNFRRIIFFPKSNINFLPHKHLLFLLKLWLLHKFSAVIVLYNNDVEAQYNNIRTAAHCLNTESRLSLNGSGKWHNISHNGMWWDIVEYILALQPKWCYRFWYIELLLRRITRRRERESTVPTKISFITDTLTFGGLEKVMSGIAEYFVRKGYQVQMISAGGGSLVEQLETLPIRLDIFQMDLKPGASSLRLVGWYADRLRDFQPDVLFSYHYPSFTPALIAGIWANIPLLLRSENQLVNVNGVPADILKQMQALESLFDHVFVISGAVRQTLTWLKDKQCEIILGTCLNQAKYLDINVQKYQSDFVIFTMIAMLYSLQGKGFDILFKAIATIKKYKQNFKVQIIGAGPDLIKAKEMCEQLGILDHVRFLGFQADVAPLLLNSQVLLLPSRYEGLGLVVAEGMMAGCCVIASRIGGIPELIDHERDGLLVEPGDDVELANAMLRVIENQDLITLYGQNARAKAVEFFTEATMYEKIEQMMLRKWKEAN